MAYCYDVLHSDDLGKWGKHLWPLILDVLEEIPGARGALAKKLVIDKFQSIVFPPLTIMNNSIKIFPRWVGLKHFNTVYTDGQTFFDILKYSMFKLANSLTMRYCRKTHPSSIASVLTCAIA